MDCSEWDRRREDYIRESEKTAAFARCSAGKGKWFWVVWDSLNAVFGHENRRAVAYGFERGAQLADQKAIDVLTNLLPGKPVKRFPADKASSYRRQLVDELRQRQLAKAQQQRREAMAVNAASGSSRRVSTRMGF